MTVAELANPSVAPSDRNALGHFAPGNPGGPGRPPKAIHIERDVITLIANAVTAEDWGKMTQAVVRKASEGNITAMSLLLRTLLNGRLNAAAAAEAIGLPTEVEMFELGCKLHPRWLALLDANRRAELAQEVAQQSPGASPAAEPAAEPEPAAPVMPAAPSESAAGSPAPAATVGATPAPAVTPPTAASPTPGASSEPPRGVRPPERIQGFRVTKGVPVENRRKRWNHAKTSPTATSQAG